MKLELSQYFAISYILFEKLSLFTLICLIINLSDYQILFIALLVLVIGVELLNFLIIFSLIEDKKKIYLWAFQSAELYLLYIKEDQSVLIKGGANTFLQAPILVAVLITAISINDQLIKWISLLFLALNSLCIHSYFLMLSSSYYLALTKKPEVTLILKEILYSNLNQVSYYCLLIVCFSSEKFKYIYFLFLTYMIILFYKHNKQNINRYESPNKISLILFYLIYIIFQYGIRTQKAFQTLKISVENRLGYHSIQYVLRLNTFSKVFYSIILLNLRYEQIVNEIQNNQFIAFTLIITSLSISLMVIDFIYNKMYKNEIKEQIIEIFNEYQLDYYNNLNLSQQKSFQSTQIVCLNLDRLDHHKNKGLNKKLLTQLLFCFPNAEEAQYTMKIFRFKTRDFIFPNQQQIIGLQRIDMILEMEDLLKFNRINQSIYKIVLSSSQPDLELILAIKLLIKYDNFIILESLQSEIPQISKIQRYFIFTLRYVLPLQRQVYEQQISQYQRLNNNQIFYDLYEDEWGGLYTQSSSIIICSGYNSDSNCNYSNHSLISNSEQND